MVNEIGYAQILLDSLETFDCGLVDADGEEPQSGWVALTGPKVRIEHPVGLPEIRAFVEANPLTPEQGYTIGWMDPENGVEIQQVELRETWDEVEEITQPGDEIWGLDPDDVKVTHRS